MDIVTVTCDRDFDLALLQAHSINKFLEGEHTHWIVIENTSRSLKEWESSFESLYKNHKLRLILGKEFILANHLPGYIRQQILKFVISEKITSESYLLLDSKDILLRSTDLDSWGVAEGNNLIYKPVAGSTTIQEILAPELKIYTNFALLVKKIGNYKIPDWFWAPATPFRCKTSNVRQILQSMNIESVFDPYVTNIREVSEFILYRFFSDFEDTLENTLENYWSEGSNTKFLWTNRDISIDVLLLKDSFYKSVSFHRWYIANNAKRIDVLHKTLAEDLGLDHILVKNALDPVYWTEQTRHERDHNLFNQFDFGFRFD